MIGISAGRKLFFVVWGCVLWAGCGPRSSGPSEATTRWVGQYECRQGVTDLDLEITQRNHGDVQGIFHFYHAPTGAEGSFYLRGEYDSQTREMRLFPGEWIRQPSGYMTVGMEGKVLDDPVRYEGTITHEGCRGFSVRLMEE